MYMDVSVCVCVLCFWVYILCVCVCVCRYQQWGKPSSHNQRVPPTEAAAAGSPGPDSHALLPGEAAAGAALRTPLEGSAVSSGVAHCIPSLTHSLTQSHTHLVILILIVT